MYKAINSERTTDDAKLRFLLAGDSSLLALVLSALPKTLAIYAFGSRVAGNANAHSDLDLAVLVEGYAEPITLWDVSGRLAALTECDVDLLDMRAASTVMQYQIITKGICLWSRQPQTGLFESYVLSEKTALDTARSGLLADIRQEGKVYAR